MALSTVPLSARCARTPARWYVTTTEDSASGMLNPSGLASRCTLVSAASEAPMSICPASASPTPVAESVEAVVIETVGYWVWYLGTQRFQSGYMVALPLSERVTGTAGGDSTLRLAAGLAGVVVVCEVTAGPVLDDGLEPQAAARTASTTSAMVARARRRARQ